jgi:hypothetical protein
LSIGSKMFTKKRKSKKIKALKASNFPLYIEVVKWNPGLRKRFDDLMVTARYNLNGSRDNALAEALALAVVYRHGGQQVLAERELVRVSGMNMIAGTPDGAVILSSGGMVATQVVRVNSPKGHGGVKHVLKALLVKIFKSLYWLLNSGMGHTVSSFIIAAWMPMNLSYKAAVALNRLLQSKVGIDSRFEIVLLVPPADMRAVFFPKYFGKQGTDEVETTIVQAGALMKSICSFTEQCAVSAEGDVDLGFLAELLLADDF